ncbi:hypothetical protein [Agromyces archimandritae]|nr:hypothetical protein [Agromyces archimandritae]
MNGPFAGFRGITALHVPLGVVTIIAGVWLVVRVWMPGRLRA